MSIKKTYGTILKIKDLSKTAKEVQIKLKEPLNFIAGHFINIFIVINGEKTRRAYSISSSDQEQNIITLSVRLSPQGKMTPLFWNKNLTGEEVEIMGPLGLNSADKMLQPNIYLFAFGIGAGVVKSLLEHFENKPSVQKIILMTGSRTEDEVIYKDFFDSIQTKSNKLQNTYVVSQPNTDSEFKEGYIQDHVEGLNFNNSDVYVCGQEIACNALVEKVKITNPKNCNLFIEAFH
jgi:NAD(P)H-flavin reductase